jgi:hypothetical protein
MENIQPFTLKFMDISHFPSSLRNEDFSSNVSSGSKFQELLIVSENTAESWQHLNISFSVLLNLDFFTPQSAKCWVRSEAPDTKTKDVAM